MSPGCECDRGSSKAVAQISECKICTHFQSFQRIEKEPRNEPNWFRGLNAFLISMNLFMKCLRKVWVSWLVVFCVICLGLQLFASGLNRRAITAAVLETRTQTQVAWGSPAMVMIWASPASICECWYISLRSAASSDAVASTSESCGRSFH